MKVLVTGGLGYVGSHTVAELMEAGFETVIADNLVNSEIEVLDSLEKISGRRPAFYEADVCNTASLSHILDQHPEIRCIIHFAALKSVEESVHKPLQYYRNNVNSMITILEQMEHHGINNIVFSSSCTVYGQPDTLPVTENSPFKVAESTYGRTKQICEGILMDSCVANKKLKSLSLRYFNPVGAHSSGLIGELPKGPPANLMPIISQTAAGIRPEMKVFGNDYSTADGTALRDYIHVVDLAKSHVAAVNRIFSQSAASGYECFNVGTGRGLTVLEMIRAFERVNNVTVNFRFADRRPGDIEKIFADTSLANQVLHWRAELTVDDMVRSAWLWQCQLKERAQ